MQKNRKYLMTFESYLSKFSKKYRLNEEEESEGPVGQIKTTAEFKTWINKVLSNTNIAETIESFKIVTPAEKAQYKNNTLFRDHLKKNTQLGVNIQTTYNKEFSFIYDQDEVDSAQVGSDPFNTLVLAMNNESVDSTEVAKIIYSIIETSDTIESFAKGEGTASMIRNIREFAKTGKISKAQTEFTQGGKPPVDLQKLPTMNSKEFFNMPRDKQIKLVQYIAKNYLGWTPKAEKAEAASPGGKINLEFQHESKNGLTILSSIMLNPALVKQSVTIGNLPIVCNPNKTSRAGEVNTTFSALIAAAETITKSKNQTDGGLNITQNDLIGPEPKEDKLAAAINGDVDEKYLAYLDTIGPKATSGGSAGKGKIINSDQRNKAGGDEEESK